MGTDRDSVGNVADACMWHGVWMPVLLVSLSVLMSGCDPADSGSQKGATASQSDGDRAPEKLPEKTTPSATLSQAQRSFQAGRVEEALEMTKQLLISRPGDAAVMTLASECFLQLDQPQRAVEVLQEIDPEDPQHGLNSLGQLGDLLIQLGRPEQAAEAFQRLIRYHGDVPLAHSRVALLMNSRGMRIEAAPHLRMLAELDNITLRELSALVTIADQCSVGKVPGTTGTDQEPVRGDLRRARQLNMSGQNRPGLELCRRLRKKFPESTAIAAFMGRALMDEQDVQGLIEWQKSLPGGIETQPMYWNTLARWMTLDGNHEAAIHSACRSAELDPTSPETYETLANCLKVLGDDSGMRLAESRGDKLRETKRINQRFLMDQTGAEDFLRMSELMLDLNRPFESVAWFKESLKLGGQSGKAQRLGARLQAYQPPQDLEEWTLCRLQPDRYSPPNFDQGDKVPLLNGPGETVEPDGALAAIQLTEVASKLMLDFSYDPGDSHLGSATDDGAYFLHQTMGGGIGVLDFDLDGWPDVYFSQAGGDAFEQNEAHNALFRSRTGTTFQNVIDQCGADDPHYGQGVTAVDLNQDGWIDLVVANIGANVAFRNNGDGSFSSVALPAAWGSKQHWTSHIACADLDGDTLPDWIECNYIDDPKAFRVRCTATEQLCAPAEFTPAENRFLRSDTDGTLQVWSGGGADKNYSLGVVIGDFDSRFGNDVFVANDTRENTLWMSGDPNSADGKRSRDQPRFGLTEQARLRGCATGALGELQGCMGIASGDFDRNGTFDFYVTNYFNEPVNLYLQQDAGLFIDNAARFKLRTSSLSMVGFGTQAADLDCDGWQDLVVLNGHAVDRRDRGEPLKMKPQVYRGGRGVFTEVTPDEDYWGRPRLGRTLASWDFNRDGKIDLLANHLQSSVAVLRNETESGNWIQFELVGTGSERDATGARLAIEYSGGTQTAWMTAGDGYFCSNEPVVAVGLGPATKADRVVIQWPSGKTQELFSIEANRRYLVIEGINEIVTR